MFMTSVIEMFKIPICDYEKLSTVKYPYYFKNG